MWPSVRIFVVKGDQDKLNLWLHHHRFIDTIGINGVWMGEGVVDGWLVSATVISNNRTRSTVLADAETVKFNKGYRTEEFLENILIIENQLNSDKR